MESYQAAAISGGICLNGFKRRHRLRKLGADRYFGTDGPPSRILIHVISDPALSHPFGGQGRGMRPSKALRNLLHNSRVRFE